MLTISRSLGLTSAPSSRPCQDFQPSPDKTWCADQTFSTPPNVEFFVDDLEEEWTFNTPFDFIYMRLLTGSIKDWPKLFRNAYQ